MGSHRDLRGAPLPEPQDFGMEPHAPHTACWRGYHCSYRIAEAGLTLDLLTVYGLEAPYPVINGVAPVPVDHTGVAYRNLKLRVPFSGTIRIARDFIDALYLHVGFQLPSAYRNVLDISFQRGRSSGVDGRSAEVEALRSSGGSLPGGDALHWIERRFSRNLDLQ